MLCIVTKQYILQRKYLNKWIGSSSKEHDFTTLSTLYTDPVRLKTTPRNDRTEIMHLNEQQATGADFRWKL